eukprot:scaffold19733_cov84-Attheya_sp.AAC.1
MAAPYHADATGIPSGAPSIAAHTPNRHSDGTSDLEGVALFGEHELSILQNDALSSRTDIFTGTAPSSTTQSTNRKAEGTNRDIGTSMRDYYNNEDRSSKTNTEGVALFGEGANLPLPRTDVVGNTGTYSNIDQRWCQSDINGVALSNAA